MTNARAASLLADALRAVSIDAVLDEPPSDAPTTLPPSAAPRPVPPVKACVEIKTFKVTATWVKRTRFDRGL